MKPLYVDFDSTFDVHPVTGDLPLLVDENAVKRSIRNLILTNYYERPFQPRAGSQVTGAQFENYNPISIEILRQNVEEVISNSEPRARLIRVVIKQRDLNSVDVTIVFALLNNTREVQMSLLLNRIH